MNRPLKVDEATSKRLGRIRQKGTDAELKVRQVIRQLGFGYRTINRDLPGSPDIANRSRRWAVFVHGCFWHGHAGCSAATVPKRNRSFWTAKFAVNRARDRRVVSDLRSRGFAVLVVWRCELQNQTATTARIAAFLRAVPRKDIADKDAKPVRRSSRRR